MGGTGKKSWEDTASNAVATAAKTLRVLHIAQIKRLDVKVDDDKAIALPREGVAVVQGRSLSGTGASLPLTRLENDVITEPI